MGFWWTGAFVYPYFVLFIPIDTQILLNFSIIYLSSLGEILHKAKINEEIEVTKESEELYIHVTGHRDERRFFSCSR